jgi:hypothetical protein
LAKQKLRGAKVQLRNYINIIEAGERGCPPATMDIKLNLKNRQKAIEEYHYGPANPDEPGDYWEQAAERWNTDVDSVDDMLCGNCAAFDVTTKVLDCIEQGIGTEPDVEATIDAGQLGYCQFLKFKCAARRTCSAWVVGGPITDDTAQNAK